MLARRNEIACTSLNGVTVAITATLHWQNCFLRLFAFTFNGIWSWGEFSFRFWTKWNSIWFKIVRKTVTTIISHCKPRKFTSFHSYLDNDSKLSFSEYCGNVSIHRISFRLWTEIKFCQCIYSRGCSSAKSPSLPSVRGSIICTWSPGKCST